MVVISVSWKEFQKIEGVCGQDTHSQCTSVQYSLFTSAERTSRAWLKGQHSSSTHGLHFIFVRLKKICHLVLHTFHPFVVLSLAVYHEHIIFLIHSSFYHDTRTRRTPKYITHISKLSQSTSCAIKNHSGVKTCGGNPRTTIPTGYEPKELTAVSRIEDYSGDPYHFLMYRSLEKKITKLRSPRNKGIRRNWNSWLTGF